VGSFLSHLRIRHQLVIVLVLPIALLILLMGNNILSSVDNYATDQTTSNIYKSAAKMAHAVYELQLEREYSNSLLASHTNILRSRLFAQREKTNTALSVLTEMDRNPLLRGLFPEVSNRIYFDEELFENVNQIRTDVDARKDERYFSQYSTIIEGILRLFSAKSMMTDKPGVNSHIIALSKFLWLQEYAGRERSITYTLLSAHSRKNMMLLQEHAYNSKQQISLSKDIVALSGVDEIQESFRKMQRSIFFVTVNKVRHAISLYSEEYAADKQKNFSYDFGGNNEAADWLELSSERLLKIHEIAKLVIDKIISLTEKDKEASLYKIVIFSVGAILSVLITILLGFIITGRLIFNIEAVTQSINNIKSGEQLTSSMKLTGHDEISVLSNNFYDLTHEKQLAEKDLALAAKVFSHTTDAVMILNNSYRVISVNNAFSELTGIEEKSIVNRKIQNIYVTDRDKDFFRVLWPSLEKHSGWQGEFILDKRDGASLTTWTNVTVVINKNGEVENYIFVYTDISVLQETQKQIKFMAHHDLLTGLANRSQLEFYIEKAIARVKRNQSQIAMLFMDLNKFKNINDNLGHDIGDKVLQEVANRISNCLREEDFIARQGGDEFIAIIEGFSHKHDIINIINKIIHSVESQISIDNREMYVGISIGVSVYPNDADSMEQMASHSDMAMYRAKEESNSSFHFFTQVLDDVIKEKFKIENELRNAIKHNEFEVYYQPIVNMINGTIIGAESLIRWDHPEHGYISPVSFIPVAEESGLIVDIGDFVIDQTFLLLNKNSQIFGSEFKASINVSPVQFKSGNLSENILASLKHYNISPTTIQIEITENLLVESAGSEIQALKILHDAGITIAIDDFGTGYSSLKYLKDFPIDVVKIDGSFISGIGISKENETLVTTIINMVHGIGKKLVAEGVETAKQKQFLIQNKCDIAQGFLYSKAVAANDFINFFDSTNNVVSIKKIS